jgi:hypothetical protein
VSASSASRSVFDLPPLESGGVEARKGFDFQDHVAAWFCLEMMEDPTLGEVWCETLDDITLVWNLADGICIEFVQVKSNELDQLWTVANLCERETTDNGAGKCILEKSLAQDRCSERCRFRIVTARPVKTELALLTTPHGVSERDATHEQFTILQKLLVSRVGTVQSENSHGYVFWIENTHWDVRHNTEYVRNDNRVKLARILYSNGVTLAPDQLEELYAKILKKVWDAGLAKSSTASIEKRIKRGDFSAWLISAANDAITPSAGPTAALERKMLDAGLAQDAFANAVEQIRRYRAEQLLPKYLALDDQRLAQGEVQAVLQGLRSKLDNGDLPDKGVEFHNQCLVDLESMRLGLPIDPKPARAFVQGCMYSIASRCLHRFRRVTA